MPLQQAPNALPSSWHRNLTPASVSVKLKVALVWLVGFGGFEVMVAAGGGVVLIVQVKLAAALRFPAASCALAEKVCLPSLKGPE